MYAARRYAASVLLLILCFCFSRSPGMRAQSTAPAYRLVLHNRYVQVFDLTLAAGHQAPFHDNTNDLLWVSLDSGILEIQSRDEEMTDFQFQAGDARLFRRHELHSARNKTAGAVHSVIIELPRLAEGGCGCATEVERVVCGCARFGRLPPIWALALYGATLAETTLEAGQSLKESTDRDDTLLIAIMPLELRHETSSASQMPGAGAGLINLTPGGVQWLPEGRHQLTNVGTKPARFITIEF